MFGNDIAFVFLRAANGQLHSGYVYNWTSWLDDYGFGKCPDVKKCNVFPDGKPFPQSNDWRRKSYVYVWHTMGETADHFTFSFPKVALLHLSPPDSRPVLRDLRRLLLQRDHQQHQHPSGSRNHGGHGVQETGAQEVQPSQCGQHRFLRDRWRHI